MASGFSYQREGDALPGGRLGAFGLWVRRGGDAAGLVVAGAGLAAYVVPQLGVEHPLPLAFLALAVLSVGGLVAFLGRVVAGLALEVPFARLSPAFRRSFYTRQSVPVLILLGLTAALFALAAAHAFAWRETGSGLSAATFLVLAAVLAYPVIRYRIERRRWPD